MGYLCVSVNKYFSVSQNLEWNGSGSVLLDN